MTYDREVLRAMARARTHTDIAAAQPGAGPAASPDEFASLLRSAIDGLDDAALRAAAKALFPLPYEHPAAPLTERRRQAAACFFVAPGTFRTSGPSAPSREDQVLDAVAEALSAGYPAQGAEPTEPAPRRRSPLRIALAAALVLPAIVALAMTGGDGDRGAVVQASEESTRDGGQPPGGRRNRSIETDGQGGARADDQSTTTSADPTPTTGLAGPSVVFGPRRPSTAGLFPRSAVTLPASQTTPGATSGSPADPDPGLAPPQPVPVAQSGAVAQPATITPTPEPSAATTTTTTAVAKTGVADQTTSSTTSSTLSNSTTSSTSTSTTPAVATPGLACPGVELAVDQARLAQVIAALEALGRPSDACQQTAPQVFADLSFAEYLIAGDAAPWTELDLADGHSLVIPQSAWRSYRSAVLLSGVPAAGRPATWTLGKDGRSTMKTTTGVIVTGERTDIKHHYLKPPFLAPWLANQDRLGQPMGHVPDKAGDPNRDGDDFEHGRITMVGGQPVITTVTPLEARAMLPSAGELADSIIRQPDGTGWYVDSQLRRWWIPDGGVWGCLGDWDNVSGDNVPAAAVATLPVAGRGGCSLR